MIFPDFFPTFPVCSNIPDWKMLSHFSRFSSLSGNPVLFNVTPFTSTLGPTRNGFGYNEHNFSCAKSSVVTSLAYDLFLGINCSLKTGPSAFAFCAYFTNGYYNCEYGNRTHYYIWCVAIRLYSFDPRPKQLKSSAPQNCRKQRSDKCMLQPEWACTHIHTLACIPSIRCVLCGMWTTC